MATKHSSPRQKELVMPTSNPAIRPLSELADGEKADVFVLLTAKEDLTTRDGKPYCMVAFRDAATGPPPDGKIGGLMHAQVPAKGIADLLVPRRGARAQEYGCAVSPRRALGHTAVEGSRGRRGRRGHR